MNLGWPEGVLKSKLSRKLMKATPKAASSASELTRCFRDLPKRSIFQTKMASNRRRQASDMSRFRAGRDSLQPDTPRSVNSTPPIAQVALYARVSTLNNQDPEMQFAELREYAARRGWQIVEHERHYRSAVAFAFLQVADSTYASDVPWAIARSSDLLEQAIRSIERVHPWGGLSLTPQMRVRVTRSNEVLGIPTSNSSGKTQNASDNLFG